MDNGKTQQADRDKHAVAQLLLASWLLLPVPKGLQRAKQPARARDWTDPDWQPVCRSLTPDAAQAGSVATAVAQPVSSR